MSEQPVQAAKRPGSSAGGGNWLTKRGGPFNLPRWEWVGFGAAILVAVVVMLRHKASKQAQACPPGYAPDGQGGCVEVGGSTSSGAEVPQFVNQTYTTILPPEQPTASTPPPPETPPGTHPKSPPPRVPPKSPVHFVEYTVQKGDTLASVAKKYGITVADLAHANVYVRGEVPGDKKVGQEMGTGAGLKTGQTLKVPARA